ncbi:SHOCT domain-containing protein [uncultured Phycicoccus sp.]|uniref:SHOCT domain-containing protein n=1 Tax=uncultured Phycicoccus sp. TaxID=661422 RepID=UPI002625EE23|nr:SHOCT domain-containing protein [uncultured Phycicoccus sp.]
MAAGHGWGMLIAALALLVLWGGVIAAVVAAFGTRPRATPGPTALQVLDERLARGDIGVEEYSARRRQIVDGH